VLADELEHDDRDEGLRDAAHTEAIVSVKRYMSFQHGESARVLATRGAVIDQNEGARTPRVDDVGHRRPGPAVSEGDTPDDDRQRRRDR
jgi:hypothetical protein